MDEFNADSATKGGKRSRCRKCDRIAWLNRDETNRLKTERDADIDTTKDKRCTRCLKVKPLSGFYLDARHLTGRQSHCRKCVLTSIGDHTRNNTVLYLIRRASRRASAKGYAFTITVDDITPLPTHCPVFGTVFSQIGHENPAAYSLDRLDNTKGYVPGNVAVISYLANRLKNNGTAAQLTRIAEWMRSIGLE